MPRDRCQAEWAGARLTQHARARCRQRAVLRQALEAALDFGTPRKAGNGSLEYYLGRREVAAAWRFGLDLRRFERTAVIVSACGLVLTVYKAPRPRARREV